MKTTLVCGLLGSGKTTFVQNVLKSAGDRTVVLVNDFGKAGIDGEILSAGGIETVELPSGCVCCTLKGSLMETVRKITEELHPEHLVIEPSGLASPSGVLEALEALGTGPVNVVGIVDAAEFIDLHEGQVYGEFFRDQVAQSDVILVNKTDLVDREKTEKTMDLVSRLNPGAIVFQTVRARMEEPLPEPGRTRPPARGHGHVLPFDTLSVKFERGTGHLLMRRLLEDMAGGSYGNIKRAKALVQTERGPFRFDLSSGGVEESPFGKPLGGSRLVVIGTDLKRADILRRIKDLTP